MKRLLFIALVALAASTQAMAGDYDYLLVEQSDGTKTSFTALGLTITFSDGSFVATQDGSTTTLTLTDLTKMYFSSTASGVKEIAAPADSQATIYTASGQLVGTFSSLSAARTLLSKGLYVVKQKGETKKLTVK